VSCSRWRPREETEAITGVEEGTGEARTALVSQE